MGFVLLLADPKVDMLVKSPNTRITERERERERERDLESVRERKRKGRVWGFV